MQTDHGIQPGSVQEYVHSHPWVWRSDCSLPAHPIRGSPEVGLLTMFQYALFGASTSHLSHSPSSGYQLPFDLRLIFFLTLVLTISNVKT